MLTFAASGTDIAKIRNFAKCLMAICVTQQITPLVWFFYSESYPKGFFFKFCFDEGKGAHFFFGAKFKIKPVLRLWSTRLIIIPRAKYAQRSSSVSFPILPEISKSTMFTVSTWNTSVRHSFFPFFYLRNQENIVCTTLHSFPHWNSPKSQTSLLCKTHYLPTGTRRGRTLNLG